MSILSVVSTVRPDEIYNLAAQSHVQVSFDVPEFTADVDATGVLRVLEAVRLSGLKDTCRIYQHLRPSCTARSRRFPRTRTHRSTPTVPTLSAKQYAFWIVKEYREAYNMFCCSGILFNHESERRGETFVTRKITLCRPHCTRIPGQTVFGQSGCTPRLGICQRLCGMYVLILQHDTPEDFVIATGEMHTVREFATLAFKETGIELRWEGEGVNEKGIDTATGKVLVEVDPNISAGRGGTITGRSYQSQNVTGMESPQDFI